MRKRGCGLSLTAAVWLLALLTAGLCFPPRACAEEVYAAMMKNNDVFLSSCDGEPMTDKGAADVSWTDAYCYPSRRSAYVCVRTAASRTGEFSNATLRVWDSSGCLIGYKTDSSASTRQSRNIWYEVYSDTGTHLKEGSEYVYQFSVCFDGELYESPLYTFTTCSAGDRHLGIDVSVHNKQIDWETVAQYVDFAIIRCGYGSDLANQDDRNWLYNVSECERLGIPYGVYLYSYALSEEAAQSEAEHTIRLLQGHTPTLPVYYDLEDGGTVGKQSNAQILRQAEIYCRLLTQAGYTAGIYANHNWWTNRLWGSALDMDVRWLAAWNGAYASLADSYGVWQFTSVGRVPGISTDVDLDYCRDFRLIASPSVVPIKYQPDFILPASVRVIEDEAFAGCDFTAVKLPEGTERIGSLAFADCPKLRQVEIPASVTEIADDAFQGCGALILFGQPGSSAEAYCASHANCTFAEE